MNRTLPHLNETLLSVSQISDQLHLMKEINIKLFSVCSSLAISDQETTCK